MTSCRICNNTQVDVGIGVSDIMYKKLLVSKKMYWTYRLTISYMWLLNIWNVALLIQVCCKIKIHTGFKRMYKEC